jgi:NitT/TauT family transport system substrate-binding protein
MRQRYGFGVRLLAVIASLAIFAAACGDDDSDEGASTGSSPTETSSGGGEPQSGPGTPAPQPLAERTSVTLVASFAIEPFAPLFLADEMGEFEQENLDVEIVLVPSNEATVQVASDRALLQVGGVTAAGFNAIASDTGIRYVANVHYQSDENQEGLWVRRDLLDSDGEIDPENIPGMRIALGSGGLSSVSTIPAQRWLGEYGYTVDDIEPVPIGGADMLVAVEQGSVDAGYLITPFWQEPTVADCCVLVTPQPPLAASVYVVNETSLENDDDRDTLRAVFRALMRTVRTYLQGDYHSDPEVLDVLSQILETDADVITSSPSLRFDPDLGLETDILTESQEVWIGAGDILEFDEPLPIDDVADTSIVEELLEEGQ